MPLADSGALRIEHGWLSTHGVTCIDKSGRKAIVMEWCAHTVKSQLSSA